MSHYGRNNIWLTDIIPLNLKPWSAGTLYITDLTQKYSVGLQEIFVSRLCSQCRYSANNMNKLSLVGMQLAEKYIYVIYRLGGPDRKIFCLGLKNVPRPLRPRQNIFLSGPT